VLEAAEPAATLAQRGHALVEREYRWPELAARYVALCNEIATDRRAAAR
jgi:hypothetical protein